MSISEEKSKAIFEMRRRQILDAAITLFDEQGFSTTKISDISVSYTHLPGIQNGG